VQTVIPALPELNRVWPETITSPILWPGNFFTEPFFEFAKTGFQRIPILDHFTLVGSPGAELAPQRPTLEI
jgi:hypothetical protein